MHTAHTHTRIYPQPQRALPAHIREPVCGREVARQAQGFFHPFLLSALWHV